jgi:hypothetical protein
MFTVRQITNTFNRRGDVIATSTKVLFETPDALDSIRFRYSKSESGCWLGQITDHESNRMETLHNGVRVDFAELFRIIEGDSAYEAVLSGEADSVSEKEWLATK